MTTELRPTSLPVPAVVGIVTHGAKAGGLAGALNPRNATSGQLTRTRSTFPTSSALPPPTATTESHRPARNASAARSTSSSIGFGVTPENTGHRPPDSASIDLNAGVPSSPRSVTMSGLDAPSAASRLGTSLTVPGPNSTVVGKEKVAGMRL